MFHGDTSRHSEVWLVLDEAPGAPELVLGVFSGSRAANQFFESLDAAQYPGAAMSSYDVDWNFRDGSTRYQS